MMAKFRRLQETLVGFLVLVIFLAITLQVTSRYLFGSPFSWPEEIAKFAFIWAIFIGAAIAASRHAHIAVEALTALLPRRARIGVSILVEVLVIIVLAVLIKSGIDMARMSMTSVLPAINLPLAAIYAPVPVAAALMVLEGCLRIRGLLAGDERPPGDMPA